MTFKYSDGGRSKAGKIGKSNDCAARSISIALELDYLDAIKLLKDFNFKKFNNKAISKGVYKEVMNSTLNSLNWIWVPAPIFSGRKAKYYDLPKNGRFIVRMSKHYAAVVDGVIYDTFDSSNKMVYGYWKKEI